MASYFMNSSTTSKSFICQIANRIKSEIKDINSDSHDSILKDTIEAVKHFSWETVMLELSHKVPTLDYYSTSNSFQDQKITNHSSVF